MAMSIEQGISVEMGAYLSKFFADRPDAPMVNRWVMAVELIDPNGKRGTMYMASEDMDSWEVIGMHETASEYARIMIAYNLDDVEDEEDVEYVIDDDEEEE